MRGEKCEVTVSHGTKKKVGSATWKQEVFAEP